MNAVSSTTFTRPDLEGLSISASVMALFAEANAVRGANAKQDIEINSDKLERLRADAQRAIEDAMEAEEDAGFWGSIADFFGGDVAKVAQAVAAAAAIVATGGAATPFVVAAIACAAAAEIGQAAGLDPKICLALSVASAALGLAGGGGGAGLAAGIRTGATVAGGTAEAIGGGASIAEGEYRADVLRANARGNQAESQQAKVQLLLEQILNRLQDLEKERTRGASVSSQIAKDTHYAGDRILGNFHGGAR
jgi:hypothetical protein